METRLSSSVNREIARAVHILKTGGVVAFPTDTVYGLGADASSKQAIEKIFRLKQRPSHLPLPLLIAEAAQMTDFAQMVPDVAWLLANLFWPGGLTLVLPKASSVLELVSGGGNTVALRVPNHPIPRAIIRGLGAPIIGTSANLSGGTNPLTAQEVHKQLGAKVDLIIDGGKCSGGIESTIIDLSRDIPAVLREGAISSEELQRAYKRANDSRGVSKLCALP